jgi:LysR family transcriptional regulator, transcriptional activator of nhaA
MTVIPGRPHVEWFSYQHLYYFWVVSKEGSIVNACKRLHLSQPTVSAQIRALESALGEPLFDRVGKRLVLNAEGRLAARYADEIFTLGQEFLNTLKGRPTGRMPLLRVGVVDVIPKSIVRDILDPIYEGSDRIRLVCREEKAEVLFMELASQKLDILITDAPLGPDAKIKAFSHLLGESGMTFMATPKLAARLRKGFPKSLDGAPMLVPMDNTVIRRSLDQWLDSNRIKPDIIGEFQDGALLDAFGMQGRGVFMSPTVGEKSIRGRSDVSIVGQAPEVRGQFYIISPEKKVRNPAAALILEATRKRLAPEMK